MKELYKYDVSIGLPVYGVEKYIRKSLLSVLDQDFNGDIEIIVIDDCGPDKSMDIVKELQSNHPKGNIIKIFKQPHNMGCWAARNRILDEAQGKYLLFVDPDDYISINTVSKLYTTAEQYKTEVVYGSVEAVDEEGNPVTFSKGDMLLPFKTLLNKDELAGYANQNMHATLYNFIWNVLLRMDFVKTNNLRFSNTRFADDILFETKMQPLVTRAVLLPDITYHYVLRPGSLSNFQHRDMIPLTEIQQHFAVYSQIKNQVRELKDKPYYTTRCIKVIIYMLYIVTGAIKNKSHIKPQLTDKMIRDAMRHPISICEILTFKSYRFPNLIFALIGKLPAPLAVRCYIAIGKMKHLL